MSGEASKECVAFRKCMQPPNNGLELTTARCRETGCGAFAAQPGVLRTEAMNEEMKGRVERRLGSRGPGSHPWVSHHATANSRINGDLRTTPTDHWPRNGGHGRRTSCAATGNTEPNEGSVYGS